MMSDQISLSAAFFTASRAAADADHFLPVHQPVQISVSQRERERGEKNPRSTMLRNREIPFTSLALLLWSTMMQVRVILNIFSYWRVNRIIAPPLILFSQPSIQRETSCIDQAAKLEDAKYQVCPGKKEIIANYVHLPCG